MLIRVLYDGWPLIRQPLSPAALHLLAILDALPPQVQPIVALPGLAPAWLGKVETILYPTPDRPFERLRWEQLHLPRLARQVKADLLHLTIPSAPISGQVPSLVSPCGYFESLPEQLDNRSVIDKGLWSRLRTSFARGGLVRAQALLIPQGGIQGQDRATGSGPRVVRLPPLIHPDFTPPKMPDVPGWENGSQSANEDLEDLELPETFILYHGPADPAQLRRLAECWSWAAGPIGDYYPLLLIGLSDKEQSDLAWLIKAYRMEDSLRPLPPISPAALAWLFRRCSAVFHPAPSSPWGGSVHHALACGKPFVALDTPLTSSIVGPAAYLVPDEEASSLGAAIITVIVEEQVADQLSKAALQRSADWDKDLYGNQLASVYQDIVG